MPLDGLELFALRMAATLAAAELSYRIVEMPVRRGTLGRAWASRPRHRLAGLESRQWAVAGFGAATVLVAMSAFVATESGRRASLSSGPDALQQAFAATFGTPVAEPWAEPSSTELPPSQPPGELQPAAIPTASAPAAQQPLSGTAPLLNPSAARPPARDVVDAGSEAPTRTPTVAPTSASGSTSAGAAPTPRASTTPSAPTPAAGGETAPVSRAPSVTAIGDSVMLGAVDQLAAAIPGIEIDGELGLQARAAVEALRALRDSGRLGDAVVLHIGNNGVIQSSEFEAIMEIVEDVPRVVFLNVKVPRAWEDRNNDLLASRVSQYPNAVLVDWRAASVDEASYFWNDGVHLRAEGAAVYAALIAAQITAR